MLEYISVSWLNGLMKEFAIEPADLMTLTAETRIEPPELSYAQALLHEPIPFEHRAAYLSEYDKTYAIPMTAQQMAKDLDITPGRVRTILGDVDAPIVSGDDSESAIYDEYAFGVVREEVEWQTQYDELDWLLSAKSIGKHLGKNAQWVQYRTNELGVFPSRQLMPSKRYAMAYEKPVILALRHWILHHIATDDLYTVNDLSAQLGRHPEWVNAQLEDLGAIGLERTARSNGILTLHYTQEVFDQLLSILQELPPPAGDWLTVGTMAAVLERDRRWVLARIGPYRGRAEIRLDDWGRQAVHYPPEVFDDLTEENEQLRELDIAA